MEYYRRPARRPRPFLQPTPPRKRSPKKAVGVLLALVILLGIGGFFVLGEGKSSITDFGKKEEPKPQKVRIEGRYLFAGTVVWARHMQDWSKNADGTTNNAYPFSGLSTFEREKYDAWLADLECPVLSQEVTVAQQVRETAFNCRPEFLPEAAKYFNFFNLANNHTHDITGPAALDETRTRLEANGIQHFGDFEPGNTENTCEVVALPVRIISELNGVETAEAAQLPVALCAWHYFFRLPQPGEIEVMKQYAEAMPVFAFLQAGAEYRPKADNNQEYMTHKIADQGPAFVVENSAHWVQNGEVYNGTLILYSTGNFIFDQQQNSEVTRSASLDATMSIPYSDDLQALLDLAPSCKAYKDTCFETIKSQALPKPTLPLTYQIVAGDSSNKLTKRAGADIQAAVEERVGWERIKAELGQQ